MTQDQQIIEATLMFTAKFGFVTRDIFFQHLCPRSRNRKYSNWKNLKKTGYFRESRNSNEVLYLTLKGATASGIRAVKPRFASYIPHDSEVAHFLFAIGGTCATVKSWTESQLKEAPWDALSLMGSKNLDKLPDAIVDLCVGDRAVRVAVEMECNRKSKERYEQIALSYIGAKKIDLIIFVGDRASDLEVIRKAFASTDLTPALLQISEFKRSGPRAEVFIEKRKLVLAELLEKLLNVSRESMRYGPGTVVPGVETDFTNAKAKIA